MSRTRKGSRKGSCAYCGREAELTDDHIPPKSLFPKSLWGRLLKIPSCNECNGGASKDDEYLRTMVGLSAKGERDEILQPLSDATVRALARPEAERFAKSILRTVRGTFVPTPSGIIVPAFFGTVDLDRLDLVTARIIKGIFYTERGLRLSSDYRVVTYSMEGLKCVPKSVGQQLKAIIDALIVREPKLIGGTQFLHWSDYNPDDYNQSMWLLIVHRHHFFIGWTVPT